MFRGREQSRPELGRRLLERLAEDIVELGYVESAPKQDGRNMIMVIGPTKKKAEAKAEQRRSREQRGAAGAHGDAAQAEHTEQTEQTDETPQADQAQQVPTEQAAAAE
jgi:translation initiation factor IF-3